MTLFIESDVRARARFESARSFKSADRIIAESVRTFSKSKSYDIFLSHSINDSELILGMKGILEDLNYSVYIDWVDDSELDRGRVSERTAQVLRERMSASKSLFFVTTESSESSKWMPWECGYFDGIKGKVAIVPIKNSSHDNEYNGQEYLGLYPYVVKERSDQGNEMLWVFKKKHLYLSYNQWVQNPNRNVEWQRM